MSRSLIKKQEILYKYTSNNDIVVGTPNIGREFPAIENLIGMFVNTLALRNKIDKNLSFKDFRVNMLEPAILDINKYTDILVDVEYLKRGRKIEIVCFKYKPKTKEELAKIQSDSFE